MGSGENQNPYVKITFYKDKAHNNPGLSGSGSERKITVKLSTKTNKDWLTANLESLGYSDRTNRIQIGNKQATDTVKYTKPGFKKYGPGDNAKGPRFDYYVILTGVNTPTVTVDDDFDTDAFEILSTTPGAENVYNHLYIWGGNQDWQGDKQTEVTCQKTTEGVKLTATVPKKDDGSYFPYYRITYSLKLKEGVDLEQLAIQRGGTYTAKNTAKYGSEEAHHEFKTTYDPLTKERIATNPDLGGTVRDAKFKITYNPSKGRLFDGANKELHDTLNKNLAIDASTIQVTAEDKSGGHPTIKYWIDYSGDATVVKFDIPDETKVEITYTAKVMGSGTGIHVKNEAKIGDYKKVVDEWKDMGAVGEGEASVINLKVLKVDAYNQNKKLDNVKFKFYRADGEPVGKKDGADVYELYYHTNDDGVLFIDGDASATDDKGASPELYAGVEYKLEEIEAKDGYGKMAYPYSYTFTYDANKVNHQGPNYIYYYNDSTHIENWPLEGLVVEKKVTNDGDSEKLFNFKITAWTEDASHVKTFITGKNGDDVFNDNGEATFTIKAGQQKQFWGFKKGTHYKVEEILTDEEDKVYTTSVSYEMFDLETDSEGNIISVNNRRMSPYAKGMSHSGVLTSGSYETVSFKNERSLTGSLKIRKTVWFNADKTNRYTGTLADGTYNIKVNGPIDEGYTGDQVEKNIAITIQNGKPYSATIDSVQVPFDNQNYVEVKDLKPGHYYVTEVDNPKNGTYLSELHVTTGGDSGTSIDKDNRRVVALVSEGKAGTTIEGTGKANFYNNINTYQLRLKKKITVNGEDSTNSIADGTYHFTVTGPDEISEEFAANKVSVPVTIAIKDGVGVSATVNGQATELMLTGSLL